MSVLLQKQTPSQHSSWALHFELHVLPECSNILNKFATLINIEKIEMSFLGFPKD